MSSSVTDSCAFLARVKIFKIAPEKDGGFLAGLELDEDLSLNEKGGRKERLKILNFSMPYSIGFISHLIYLGFCKVMVNLSLAYSYYSMIFIFPSQVDFVRQFLII